MGIKILPLEVSDISSVLDVIWAASEHPVHGNKEVELPRALYGIPGPHEKEGKQRMVKVFTDRLTESIDSGKPGMFKAVDTDGPDPTKLLGAVMLNAVMTVPDSLPPFPGTTANEGPLWEEYARSMFTATHERRLKAMREFDGPSCVLTILSVDPDHQRRGIGTALIRRALQVADEIGAKTQVDASPEGLRAYEQCGFKTEEKMVRPCPAGLDRPKSFYYFMTRLPQKAA